MENIKKALSAIREAGIEVYENEKLSEHSSFKIGGDVSAFALPANMDELIKLCGILRDNSVVPMVLGNGTNILFPDEGLKNVLIICTEKLCTMQLIALIYGVSPQPEHAPENSKYGIANWLPLTDFLSIRLSLTSTFIAYSQLAA